MNVYTTRRRLPTPYPLPGGGLIFSKGAPTFAKATAGLPSDAPDSKDERRSRESFKQRIPLPGEGVGVGLK
jgi:hypothetical protein